MPRPDLAHVPRSAAPGAAPSMRPWLRWRGWASMLLGVALCWLAARSVDWASAASVLRGAQLSTLVLAFALAWSSYHLRAWRWSRCLQRETPAASPRRLFGILMVGYFLNNLLPARGGDLVRIGLMKRRHGTPHAATLASLAMERIFDGAWLALAGLCAVGLTLPWLNYVSIAFGLAFASVLAAGRYHLRVSRRIERALGGWRGRKAFLGRHALDLLKQLGALRGQTLREILLATALIWLVEAASYHGVALAFGVDLAPATLVSFVVVANFASLVPTPGGIGAVELLATSALAQQGVPAGAALVVVAAQHGLQYLLCLVFGLWHMARLRLFGAERSLAGAITSVPVSLRR